MTCGTLRTASTGTSWRVRPGSRATPPACLSTTALSGWSRATTWRAMSGSCSGEACACSNQDFAHHPRFFDAGQLEIEPLVLVGEPLVVDAELVEHRGVQVADVDGVFDRVVAHVIGRAVGD